ncbi:ABC transporter ATP-binding protein [Saccharothrix luteola]|uniref:ABC transporter ATP-binding protein n=1 Tax=Saccharothrix luteola TaxID=2893018 RepID=UPI001E4AC6AD|nr:ABC transporter ATP-binding protein [Saccharothrix luteola]MCC8249784.1 ABC transporter ATP-binding protein [Saccharothrix luteola]
MSLLSVRHLTVSFGAVDAVAGISFDLDRGRVLCVVGESGSGKTVAALAVPRLLPAPARITGRVLFDGEDLTAAAERRLRDIRGRRIGVVFQDPASALNPVLRIGDQVDEALRLHDRATTRRQARSRTLALLELVGVTDPQRRAEQYPHQWSGGMRQRALIAIALANDPDLVIADEPTAALDATVQAQVLRVLADARADRGCAVLLITHDLGVVADLADDVVVMYAGRIVEARPASALFTDRQHPYTRTLLDSRPVWAERVERLRSTPGSLPDPRHPPAGCAFHPRCVEADARCAAERPVLLEVAAGHRTACHHRGDR